MNYNDILETFEEFPVEDQINLANILYKRAIDKRRDEITGELQNAEREFHAGILKPQNAEDIMKDLLS